MADLATADLDMVATAEDTEDTGAVESTIQVDISILIFQIVDPLFQDLAK